MECSVRLGYGIALAILSSSFFVIYLPILLNVRLPRTKSLYENPTRELAIRESLKKSTCCLTDSGKGGIFFIDKEFRRSTAYIIMTHIGVTDALQLVVHMYSAVVIITNLHISFTLQKIVGAFLTGLWFATLSFTLLLTINRLTTILLHKWFPILTSSLLNYVLFALCYMSFAVPFMLKLLPDCNYVFNSETFSWSYLPSDGPISKIMSQTSRYLILVTVSLSVISYVTIFCFIGFFVSLIILYFLFSFFYWDYIMVLFGTSTLSDFLSCVVWVVMNGIHSIIYIVFNVRLRRLLFQLFTRLKMPRDMSSMVTATTMMKASPKSHF